ncbi:MAG: GNAT family N-acetyltransferase [Chitinophagaceae bacterium]|nr:GNAT family N-acetyltransferase [Chitinophagaceae bacterium]
MNNLERVHQKAAIGFWLLPEYWGSGIITAAVSLVCDYGFNSLRLHRRVALIETENDNAKKVMDYMPG